MMKIRGRHFQTRPGAILLDKRGWAPTYPVTCYYCGKNIEFFRDHQRCADKNPDNPANTRRKP